MLNADTRYHVGRSNSTDITILAVILFIQRPRSMLSPPQQQKLVIRSDIKHLFEYSSSSKCSIYLKPFHFQNV